MLSSSLCPPSEDCEKSEIPTTIFVEFSLFVQVKYNDGQLFDGKIEAAIWKKTCDGKMRSYNAEKGYLNQGYFSVGKSLISMDNEKDKIHYRFTAYYTPFYPATELQEEIVGSFDYAQVIAGKDDNDEFEQIFYIEIPTDSDGH